MVLNRVTNGLLGMLGVRPEDGRDNALSREELRTVVSEAGAMIPERSRTMLLAILDLENATVEDIMIPRNEVDGIDIRDTEEEIVNRLNHYALKVHRLPPGLKVLNHSRIMFPVSILDG